MGFSGPLCSAQRNLRPSPFGLGLEVFKNEMYMASGVMQILELGNTKIYQHVGIYRLGDAKVYTFHF